MDFLKEISFCDRRLKSGTGWYTSSNKSDIVLHRRAATTCNPLNKESHCWGRNSATSPTKDDEEGEEEGKEEEEKEVEAEEGGGGGPLYIRRREVSRYPWGLHLRFLGALTFIPTCTIYLNGWRIAYLRSEAHGFRRGLEDLYPLFFTSLDTPLWPEGSLCS